MEGFGSYTDLVESGIAVAHYNEKENVNESNDVILLDDMESQDSIALKWQVMHITKRFKHASVVTGCSDKPHEIYLYQYIAIQRRARSTGG